MQPSPQPHPQPKMLDDLIANAEHDCDFCMRYSGSVAPALFFLGPDGQGLYCPESLAHNSAEDDFASNARLVCIAHAATACVLTLKSWMKTAKPGEKLNMTAPPSEAFDRGEVFVLLGKLLTGRSQKILPFIRSSNGKFFGFGQPEPPELDAIAGRLTQLLPTKVPGPPMRDLAKAMLKVKHADRPMAGHTQGQLKSPSVPSSASRNMQADAIPGRFGGRAFTRHLRALLQSHQLKRRRALSPAPRLR